MNNPFAVLMKERDAALPVASRYFVAKYIPDLIRQEPRNIGVVLWTPSGVLARFIGEDDDGRLDSRRVPEWLGDATVYREWVAFWRGQCAKGLDAILGPLEALDYDSEGRIRDTLLGEVSKAHWILAPGGVVLDPVEYGQDGTLLTRLFDQVISFTPLIDQLATLPVEQIVGTLIKALDLKKNPHFHKDYHLKVKTKTGYELTLDYAYVGKKVNRVWQTLPVFPHQKQMHTYAESTAFRLNLVHAELGLKDDNMQVLHSMTVEQERKNKKTLSMVGEYAQVFNIRDTQERTAVFANLPKLDALEGTPLSPTE